MKHRVLKVNPKDNVIVALTNLSKGETISFEGEEYILQDNINAKHKFFTKDLNAVMRSSCMECWWARPKILFPVVG